MKEYIASNPIELKGFYAMAAGTVVQLLSSANLVQVMGFLVAVAGLIVQVSAYLKNRAETKKAEEEIRIKKEGEKREAEMHEAQMHFIKRGISRAHKAENEVD
jgi:membrane protein implicated in regulation of membrane protease activity